VKAVSRGYISPRTVETHRANLMRILNLAHLGGSHSICVTARHLTCGILLMKSYDQLAMGDEPTDHQPERQEDTELQMQLGRAAQSLVQGGTGVTGPDQARRRICLWECQ
jgi:hypothetical protein